MNFPRPVSTYDSTTIRLQDKAAFDRQYKICITINGVGVENLDNFNISDNPAKKVVSAQ